MSRSRSNHEPRPRNRGKSKRPQVVFIRETRVLLSTDSRVFTGEPARLFEMSNGSYRIALPNQRGVVASHGHLVMSAEVRGYNTILSTESGEQYSIPSEHWLTVSA